LNLRPLVSQTSALTGLRHAPMPLLPRSCSFDPAPVQEAKKRYLAGIQPVSPSRVRREHNGFSQPPRTCMRYSRRPRPIPSGSNGASAGCFLTSGNTPAGCGRGVKITAIFAVILTPCKGSRRRDKLGSRFKSSRSNHFLKPAAIRPGWIVSPATALWMNRGRSDHSQAPSINRPDRLPPRFRNPRARVAPQLRE
jgi:hypothetical protein